MLRSLNELLGYEIMAKDGQIGRVDDFFFNDEDWAIRYLIVDTGPWIFGKKVLISPQALLQPVWASETFPVNLTREEVQESPDADLAKPVSREYEEKLRKHYSWAAYWSMSPSAPTGPLYLPPNLFMDDDDGKNKGLTSHLRSTIELLDYEVQVRDGDVGSVKDFIVDDENWQLIYIVIDTNTWLETDKQILVALEWISHIEVSSRKITLGLKQDAIKYSPPFDPNLPVNRQYEEVLYDYYGRPKYWQVVEETE